MKISVVIPAYNVEKWIAGAVRSVLQQRPAPHEVIVVNDGSIDSTASVVSEFDPRVRLISQQNRGPAAARNTGIRVATGDVVYLLDADDEALPGAFSEVLKAFDSDEEAGAVSGNFVQTDDGGGEQLAWVNHPDKLVLRRSDTRALLRRNHLSANSAFRLGVLNRYMFREDSDLRGCEDLDLWLRLVLDDVPIVTLGRPLCRYRVTRVGALTAQSLVMRRHRNFLFRQLLHDRRLHPRERLLVIYQCFRSAIGIVVARLSSSDEAGGAPLGAEQLSVLQVVMNEPGGGRTHVDELQAGLEGQANSHVLELTRGSFARPSTWLGVRAALSRSTKELEPNIIHAHGVRAAAATLSARCNAKRIVTIHGLHSLRRSSGVNALVSTALNKAVMSRMARIFVLSASDRERLQRARVPAGRIQTIRTTVRAHARMKKETAREHLRLAQDAFVVLWLGRFEKEKDPITFVAAMRELQGEGIVAIMGGNGSLMPKVARAIREDNLSDAILLPGWLGDPSVAFAAADVFVTTSLWEGFPLAALEGAAAGLPLVASDVAGNRDIVACGISARLVPARDSGRVAAELRLARDQSRGSCRSQDDSGSWIPRQFSRKHLTADVLDGYEMALDRGTVR